MGCGGARPVYGRHQCICRRRLHQPHGRGQGRQKVPAFTRLAEGVHLQLSDAPLLRWHALKPFSLLYRIIDVQERAQLLEALDGSSYQVSLHFTCMPQ